MKLSLLMVAASMFASSIAAQGLAPINSAAPPQVRTCDVSRDNAPSFRGLRLGMTEDAAAAVLGAKFAYGRGAPSGFGSAYVNVRSDSTSKFTGIARLEVASVDGRVTTIDIQYRPEWRSLKGFADQFIPQIPLPPQSWLETDGRFVNKCSGFEIQLSLSGRYGHLRLDDPDSRMKKYEQIEAEKEFQRKTLKP